MSEDDTSTPFGRLLRRRRTRRNVTQEELSYRADLSARHVSFLETGRSDPSPASVLALASALDLPLRDRNVLLHAAGFAAVYPDRDILASEDSHVRSLFAFLLRRHEPYPAYVVDRTWTVRMHNRGAVDLLRWLLGEPLDPSRHRLAGTNLLRLLFDPEGLRPLTVNFEEVGRFLLDRLEEEIALYPDAGALEELRRELEGLGPVPVASPGLPEGNGPPALPIHLRKNGIDLRLLSFLLTAAAPREVGLQEIRLETFLPADGDSDAVLREEVGR